MSGNKVKIHASQSHHLINQIIIPTFTNSNVFPVYGEVDENDLYLKTLYEDAYKEHVWNQLQTDFDLSRIGRELLEYIPEEIIVERTLELLPELSMGDEDDESDEDAEVYLSGQGKEDDMQEDIDATRLNLILSEAVGRFSVATFIDLMHKAHEEGKEKDALQLLTVFFANCDQIMEELVRLNLEGTVEAIGNVCEILYFLKLMIVVAGKVRLSGTIDELNTRPLLLFPTFVRVPLRSVQRLFFEHNLLNYLLILVYSYCDEIRYQAVAIMIYLGVKQFSQSEDGSLLSVDRKYAVKTNAQNLYMELSDGQRWINILGKHTFATEVLPLTTVQAFNIMKQYEIWIFQNEAKNHSIVNYEVLHELSQQLDSMILNRFNGGPVFLKLSSRSPKDAVFDSARYIQMHERLTSEWKDRYGVEYIENHASIQSAIEQICAAKCILCEKGQEFVDLMTRSERVHRDLSEALSQHSKHNSTQSFPLSIVVREWEQRMLSHFEMRSFVRNRKINAISQYFSKSYFPFVSLEEWREIKERVVNYYETDIKPLLPYDDCIIDFVVLDNYEFRVIELNSFGGTAGPALFDWNTDEQILYNGPLQMRVIGDAEGTVVTL